MKAIKTTVYIESVIHLVPSQRVIMDADLAKLYGVTTKRLNEQVKRNLDRFPQDFMFQLTLPEINNLKSQIATSKQGRGGRRYKPYAFTEHGAMMATNILNSPKAIEMSVFVIRAFVKMREVLGVTRVLEKRLAEIEKKLLLHDSSLRDLYERIRPLLLPPPEAPKRKIGFRAEDPRAKYLVSRN